MNGTFAVKFLNAIILLVLFLYFVKSTKAEYSKTSGLIPFPRVGRANHKIWKSRILGQIKRREGLIPFPRVGRSGKDNTETWLGSRSSRDFQRIYPDLEDHWMVSASRDNKQSNEFDDFPNLNRYQVNNEGPFSDDEKNDDVDLLITV